MRAHFISVAVFLTLVVCAYGGDKRSDLVWKCYSMPGDDGKLEITNAETVPIETFSNHPPNATKSLNPGETPGKFSGMSLSPGMTVTREVIAQYHGRDVYLFTCKHVLEPDEPQWTFDWAVLACDATAGNGPKMVKVFFVEQGDAVRSFGASSDSSKEHPNRIKIGQQIDGNGMMENTCTVELTDAGPWVVEAVFGARKSPTWLTATTRQERSSRLKKKRGNRNLMNWSMDPDLVDELSAKLAPHVLLPDESADA
jgi:hypothetical protein